MATSPTPSLDSLPGATNSIRSFGEQTDFLSDSPLTLSGSSPTVSDSAICDDFPLNGVESSAPSSQTASSSERVVYPRCTGCKSKELDAVAKCIDCANYLCSNCVTAHQYMHCFNGHSVFRIGSDGPLQATTSQQQHQPQLQQQVDIMNGFDSHRLALSLKDETLLNKANNMTSLLSGTTSTNPTSTVTGGLSSLLGDNGGLLGATTSATMPTKPTNSYFCLRHKSELLKFYCRTCSVTVCKDCIVAEHPSGLHDCEHVNDGTPKQIESLLQLVADVRGKATDMRAMVKSAEHNTARIQVQYHKAQTEINETHNFYRSLLDDRKQDLLKELESFYNAKTLSQSVLVTKSQEHIDKVLQSCEFVERLTKHAGLAETIMLRKLMENKLQSFMGYIQDLQSTYELEFVSNYQAIQVGVRNTFGYIRSSSEAPTKQPPIARPTSNSILTNGSSPTSSTGSLNVNIQPQTTGHILTNGCHAIERPFSNGGTTSIIQASTQPQTQSSMSFDSTIISKRFNSVNSLGPFVGDVNIQVNPYEKWSNGGSDNIFNSLSDQYTIPLQPSQNATDSVIDLTSKLMSTSIFPPKSQIKRQKMIYHCKFGEFGVMEGQFTEPSGVAVNAQNDIIVADTNNHRIQIFDKEGRFKFQFGECGKRDGQLLYPNRVAVVRTSGDIIVTERSPTHQIQIYNQYGQFVRKFGANILQHPRGVTVDNKGRIIVVECKVMRVIIFDQSGNVLQKFGCSKHLEFPNGVVVNDKQEIFISDNRAHCVKVFNYEGVFLRQIGGEGITNYPIGVGINAAGEILIADNHNNFNLTIFTQDGQLVSALESKVKHAQCFDVALMDDGSVVLASKDYRLYIYRLYKTDNRAQKFRDREKHSEELIVEDFAIYFLNLIKTQTEEITRCAPSVTTTPQKMPANADSLLEKSPSPSMGGSMQQTLHETTSMCLETREFRTSTPIKSPGWGNSGQSANSRSTPNGRKTYSRTICLADFLMSPQEQRGKKNKAVQHARTMSADQVKPKRRVVPLSVPKNPTPNEQFLTSSFRSDNNLETLMRQQRELERTEGREDERFLLKMHKDLISQDFENEKRDSRSLEPIKAEKVSIDLSAVTNSHTLNLFACIYSVLIDWNLVTNVLSELAFLLNLLNADFVPSACVAENAGEEVLKSANNCVFFAFGVLNRQRKLLALLDAPTIRILLDNERIAQLQESLHKFLTTVHRHKVQLISSQRVNEGSLLGNISVGQGNVFYQQENDTRENFPSGKEFAAFKNQRDGFYTILRAWEVNHLSATWDFSRGLAPKVRQLLAQLPLPVNMAHLAKLFTAQLIISCTHEDAVSQLQDDLGANVDIGKLSKLNQRLTAPGHSSAELQFPGVQVFFRDFIVASEGCSVFVEQLKIALIVELTELNDAPFEVINLTNSEENLNDFTDVVANPEKISTMRTLAKFLGFTMSRPYPYENGRNSVVDSQQITLRNLLLPQFDVKKILLTAIEEGKLLVTIPWLVEYLSMLDHVTMQLDYYRALMEVLYKLHADLGVGKLTLTPTCLFILRLCLGWLFDCPNLLADDYYDFRRRQKEQVWRKPASRTKNGGRREIERSLMRTLTPALEAILNVACPFLGDFRLSVMSTRATKTLSRTGRYRHITTKLTTESPKKKSSEQDAQKQLTEAFLQSQSPSMRKIVDFVTERVTSAVIKNFQVLYFLDIKKATQKEVREIQGEDHEVILRCLRGIYEEAQEKLNRAWDDSVPTMIAERATKALDALLAIETLEAVKKTCGDIVKQRCLARAEDWRTLHSKEISFLHDDLTFEAMKIAKNIHSAQQGGGSGMEISISDALPSDVFENLQQLLHKASLEPTKLSAAALQKWLNDLRSCLAVNTFVPQMYKTTAFMMHELLLTTIFHRSDIVSQEIIETAIECWKHEEFAPFVTPSSPTDGTEEGKNYIFAHLFHALNLEILSRKSPEVQCKFHDYATSLSRAGFVIQANQIEQQKEVSPKETQISVVIFEGNSKDFSCRARDCDDLANIVPDLHL